MIARRLLRRASGDTKGATAVEFALVAMPFIYLLFMAIDFVLMFSAWSTVQWACDTAARETMVTTGATTVIAANYASTAAQSVGYTTSGVNMIDFSGTTSSTCGSLNCFVIKGKFVYYFKLSAFGKVSVTLSAQAIAPMVP